jgi:2-polyprenyl-3-methyl-5-hydroxy-6-metoxy-1,4-benzoquinol methylase
MRYSLGQWVHLINNLPLWFFLRRAKTLLDVGCGVNSPVNYFVTKSQLLDGLDISTTDIAQQRQTRYRQVLCGDIRTWHGTTTYDVITALDFIEHVTHDEGINILDKLEKMAHRVVIVTPNGYWPQAPTANNPWQEHLSGWQTADFTSRGYKVYGMFGPQWLRADGAQLRYHPTWLWALIVWLLTPVWFWLPRTAFSLLAVYDRPSV